MTREEVVIHYGANTTAVDRAIRGLKGQMRDFGKSVADALNPATALKSFGAAFAGALTVGAMKSFVESIVDMTGKFKENAEAAGTSTTYFQQLGFAASQSEVSVEDASKGFQKLNKLVGDARIGVETAAGSFDKWGISLKDASGNALGTEAVMDAIADRMASIKDPAIRAAFAAEMFGDKLGVKLIPLLKDGAKAFQELREAANVITPEQIKAIDDLADSYAMFKSTVLSDGGQMIGIISQLASALEKLTGGTIGKSKLFGFLSNELLMQAPHNMRVLSKVLGLGEGTQTDVPKSRWGEGVRMDQATPADEAALRKAQKANAFAQLSEEDKLKSMVRDYSDMVNEAQKLTEGSKARVNLLTEAEGLSGKISELEKRQHKERLQQEEELRKKKGEANAAAFAAIDKEREHRKKLADQEKERASQSLSDLMRTRDDEDTRQNVNGPLSSAEAAEAGKVERVRQLDQWIRENQEDHQYEDAAAQMRERQSIIDTLQFVKPSEQTPKEDLKSALAESGLTKFAEAALGQGIMVNPANGK